MKQKIDPEIEKLVEETLTAYTAEVPPPMDPWFFERLSNRITHVRMDERESTIPFLTGILKSGMLTALVALNVLLVVWTFFPDGSLASSRTTHIESLSSEYGLNYSDAYLLEDGGQ